MERMAPHLPIETEHVKENLDERKLKPQFIRMFSLIAHTCVPFGMEHQNASPMHSNRQSYLVLWATDRWDPRVQKFSNEGKSNGTLSASDGALQESRFYLNPQRSLHLFFLISRDEHRPLALSALYVHQLNFRPSSLTDPGGWQPWFSWSGCHLMDLLSKRDALHPCFSVALLKQVEGITR